MSDIKTRPITKEYNDNYEQAVHGEPWVTNNIMSVDDIIEQDNKLNRLDKLNESLEQTKQSKSRNNRRFSTED